MLQLLLVLFYYLTTCNYSYAAFQQNYDGKIVNGTNAKLGEFPFVVSLRRAASGSHLCGASLLNDAWVLTAAHCVARAQPAQLNIQYGSNTLQRRNATKISNITRIYINDGYNPSNKYIHDIALLQLTAPLKLETRVNAVRLPVPGQETLRNSSVILVGWGLNATGGVLQQQLQKVKLKVFDDAECSSRHGIQLHKTQLCAGVPKGGKGQCSGDSGGPLIYNGTQVGIVSWSRKPCAVPPFPGVFTEVSAYIDWILHTLAEAMVESKLNSSSTQLLVGNLVIKRDTPTLLENN